MATNDTFEVDAVTVTSNSHTCVGITVSRMFFIVSIVSGGEVLLWFSLLPLLVVLDWPGVGRWSDSLPNDRRAFSETWQEGNALLQFIYWLWAWYVFILFSSRLIQVRMPPVLNCKFCLRAMQARASLDWVNRREKKVNTQYSLQVSRLHLPLHIDLINLWALALAK